MRDDDRSIRRLEDELLKAWQAAHGALEERWIAAFRNHPALARLTRLPTIIGLEAVRNNARLDDALAYAERATLVEPGPSIPMSERHRAVVDPAKTKHVLDVVALYEDQVSPKLLSNDEKAAWINNPATARVVGYSHDLLMAAAQRCREPLTPESWLVAARVEENLRQRPAGSVLEGRTKMYDHSPARPGGAYKKGDM